MKFAYLAAAAFALAACAHASSPQLAAGSRYVNMGSSFAAGAGTGPAPDGSPARCYQSSVNYAHLLAGRLNLTLEDVSCGGATSAHILNAWNELPAQIDAVTADTKLVTITIGGNDIAFAGNLTAASCEQGESIRVASLVLPCPSPFPVAADAYVTLEHNLREAARQIAVRAPEARVVFIQYVALVPDTQCARSRFTEEEAAELRAVATRLADITARAAAETGASVLRMDQFARGHTPCDADPWSTGLPRDYDGALGAPWHPNRRGMAVIADRLADLLAR
ncbi:MAG: SGNH/GDSL hydrolase family protein [Terricaulis sp.]